MIGLAALCLAGALGFALLILQAARAMGWRRRRIGLLVRPWLLAILILLTIGLAAEAGSGFAALSPTGRTLAASWLAVSVLAHLVGRGSSRADPARLWGARVAHGGVAVALGGILLSSVLASTAQRSLAPGESFRFAAWTIQLHDVWPAAGEGWTGVAAEFRVSSGDGVSILKPEQHTLFEGSSRAQSASVNSGTGELSASLGQQDAEGRWPIHLRWTPLLVLVPIGLAISALGCLGAMIVPSIIRARRRKRARLATAWWA
ncbi:MAG: cytochrome c-type biogenesis CcmF C-terminal domain-containing protein [Sphingomicrobium sp.]